MFKFCECWYAWSCWFWQFEVFVYINNVLHFCEWTFMFGSIYTSFGWNLILFPNFIAVLFSLSLFIIVSDAAVDSSIVLLLSVIVSLFGDAPKFELNHVLLSSLLLFFPFLVVHFSMFSSIGGNNGACIVGPIQPSNNLDADKLELYRHVWLSVSFARVIVMPFLVFALFWSIGGKKFACIMLLVAHGLAIILLHWMIGMH